MTRRPPAWAAALLGLAALAGCGGPPPAPPPHGLEIEALASDPQGPTWTMPGARAHVLSVVVEKTWVRVRDGGPPESGRAVLEILAAPDATGAGGRVEIRVREAEGIAEEYVRAFDGLAVAFARSAAGQPVRESLRWPADAPEGAESFVRGFWLGGAALGVPWLPPGPVREGEAFPRRALEDAAPLAATPVVAGLLSRVSGGSRLERVLPPGEGGGFVVRLETLLDVEGRRADEGVRLGIRDRGTATLDGLGRPTAWDLVEEVRLRQVRGAVVGSLDVTLRVRGRAGAAPAQAESPAAPRAAEPSRDAGG